MSTRKDPTRSAGGHLSPLVGSSPPTAPAPQPSEGRASGRLDVARLALAEVLEHCGLSDHDRAELGRSLALLTRLAHCVEDHLAREAS